MSIARTDRERWLGQENAKLAKRIWQQRLKIREQAGPISTGIYDLQVAVEDVRRENIVLKDQVRKLVAENRELRVLLLSRK